MCFMTCWTDYVNFLSQIFWGKFLISFLDGVLLEKHIVKQVQDRNHVKTDNVMIYYAEIYFSLG